MSHSGKDSARPREVLPMKRLFALFTLLAFCLTLPATAFAAGTAGARSAARALTAAAAPSGQVIYVGNENVTSGGYWTTDSEGNVTAYSGIEAPADKYIHYDAGTNTLTLHNATIKTSNSDTIVGGAAIGVLNQNGAAELTITLEGDNTIEDVSTGICVYSSTTGDASLTITGSGSLTASGSTFQGILVQSNSDNASLTIQNAEVEAAVTDAAGEGVVVRADNEKSASLSVEGGSLTATGTGANPGIRFQFGGGPSGSGTPRLTVSENAVVKAISGTGGIFSNSASVTPSGDGIVFDDGKGAVYGAVELQKDLTIGVGESLTVPDDASLTIPDGKTLTNKGAVTVETGGTLGNSGKIENSGTVTNRGTLTNNGTIDNSGALENNNTLTNNGAIDNSGTLTGTIGGAVPPSIITTPLPAGEVGETYTATLAAGNSPTEWSVTVGSLPAGLALNGSTGVISGTPITQGKSTFTVKATNSGGSHSKEFTLEIKTVAVTGVTLDKATMNLFVGDSGQLTATVQPSDASNKDVTWFSSDEKVATLNSGTVTAVGAGKATITVATVDGGKTATCQVTVTARTYALSADPAALGFGSVQTGYSQPAAVAVTVKNTGNQDLTLTQPTAAANFEVGALSKTQLAAGGTATFTVRPKAGLGAGSYSERIAVAGSGSNGGSASVVVTATFKVTQGSGTPTPTPAATPLEQHTLHFNTMGGLPLADVVRGLGAPVELWPYIPVRTGYVFQGWYKDEALTQPVSSIVLVDDTTLYAKWAVDPAAQAAAAGSGSAGGQGGGSGTGTGGGSGTGGQATPTPTPSPTPTPTPTPTPEPTVTPTATPEPETTAGGGFPVVPVAIGGGLAVAAAGAYLLLRRKR